MSVIWRKHVLITYAVSVASVNSVKNSGNHLPEGWGLNLPPPPKNFWTLPVYVDWSSWGSILTPPVHTVIGCHWLVHTARVILSWSKCLMPDFFTDLLHEYDENSFL